MLRLAVMLAGRQCWLPCLCWLVCNSWSVRLCYVCSTLALTLIGCWDRTGRRGRHKRRLRLSSYLEAAKQRPEVVDRYTLWKPGRRLSFVQATSKLLLVLRGCS
jgi:hypothetical protein